MDIVTNFLAAVRENGSKLPEHIKKATQLDTSPDVEKHNSLRRAIYWLMFAKLLNPSKPQCWKEALRTNRENYTTRKADIMKDPSAQEDDDLDTCNPLSMEEDNPYQEFYKTAQLIEEIDRDLERCCISGVPDDFFQGEDILNVMRGILAVWSTDHPDTSYRQGMHEVLGVVILALRPISALFEDETDGPDADLIRIMAEPEQMEADIYFVFDFLLKDLQRLYRVQTTAERKAQLAKIKAAAKVAGGTRMGGMDGLSMKAPLQVSVMVY